MAKRQQSFKTKGMNRDLSVSAFNSAFSFENMNLRLIANEGNTSMSWVNEKGTGLIGIANGNVTSDSIMGVPIGTAVINHKLVIFTTKTLTEEEAVTGSITNTFDMPDRIYVLSYADDSESDEKSSTYVKKMKATLFYRGNLNFCARSPLETLVSYESDNIEKVYWTDGRNQPRVINLQADTDRVTLWVNKISDGVDSCFDFVPAVNNTAMLSVTKNESGGGGVFAPGVIQYCYTYFNKYGQQSNIVDVSPLYYLCHSDRGAAADDSINCSFTLKVTGSVNMFDKNFDYIRFYSIQRTSVNATPIVKLLVDLPLSEVTAVDTSTDDGYISYVDNGTTGSLLDPTELLYVGGKEITALTMTDKDLTLFMGNISQPDSVIDDIQTAVTNAGIDIKFSDGKEGGVAYKDITLNHTYGIYSHTNLLNEHNQAEITTFKGGETYRFGFQLQKNDGEWLDPVFIGDAENKVYPSTNVYNDTVGLVQAQADIPLKDLGIDTSLYKRIRPVIVYPGINDRTVLCQGVLNPTVFNAIDRVDNSPYAQASWYFRPYMMTEGTSKADVSINPYDKDGASYITVDASGTSDNYNSVSNADYINNNLTTVYILVADVTRGIDIILSRGNLQYRYKTYNADTGQTSFHVSTHKFDLGVVKLGDSKYAFLSSTLWEDEVANVTAEDAAKADYYDGQYTWLKYETQQNTTLSNVITGPNNSLYYTGLTVDPETSYVYYTAPSGVSDANTYTFKFHITPDSNYARSLKEGAVTETYYVITFTSVSAPNYQVNADNIGKGVSFRHYDSLVAQGNAAKTKNTEGSDTRSKDDLRKIEIQGSRNIYDITDSFRAKKRSTNTQFFIDQSILTFNSPDIEFDTTVQLYGNEGLGLRIIGAVPVTAGSSAITVTTSSAMLETSHNQTQGNISHVFGTGGKSSDVIHKNVGVLGGQRLVSDYLWNDICVLSSSKYDDHVTTDDTLYDYLVFPWQRNGSLNNDWRGEAEASSWLKTKAESNMLYSLNTEYFESDSNSFVKFENISLQTHLTENDHVLNYRLPQQTATSSEINYYPNIDKVLYNTNSCGIIGYATDDDKSISSKYDADNGDIQEVVPTIAMKYKSTSHMVIALDAPSSTVKGSAIPVLPYGYAKENGTTVTAGMLSAKAYSHTFWGDTNLNFNQEGIDLSNNFISDGTHKNLNFLWLGELYKTPVNRFGGTSKSALMANTWLVGGEAVSIGDAGNITLTWDRGDTYYQRYDCLKTYAFNENDTNQIVEILSFMCETYVNIDGRYDKNRGQVDNTYISPQNFNLINEVYSQQDNYFNYRILDNDVNKKAKYPNQIYYTKTKTSGADVDLYTNISLGSVLELDGDKGEIKALRRLNNSLIAFQDSGISQVMFNENVQVSTANGVPIEIANSGKVSGKRYLTESTGCSNKWSVCTAPGGIYFIDSNDKGIYRLSGGQEGLANLSLAKGFNSWSKQNIPDYDTGWNPCDFKDFVTHYDRTNGDILFISTDTALAYSEKTETFTSFYSYGNTPYLVNLDNTGIWIKPESDSSSLYLHNRGDYSVFFGKAQPYWMTLIGNPEPAVSKTFTNVEFRATVAGDGKEANTKVFSPTLPFDSIETWNEYQHGYSTLGNLLARPVGNRVLGRYAFRHDGVYADTGTTPKTTTVYNSLKRKFRIWRCDIPRDNAVTDVLRKEGTAYAYSLDTELGITRLKAHPLDRMHNPWIYIKMKKDYTTDEIPAKTEIHDITMTYFD